MTDRNGTPIVDSCVWCGGAHDSLSCPSNEAIDPGAVVRLDASERRRVYGVIARLVARMPRRGESGFDTAIPLHKRAMICGVAPDDLERACDPGPHGGVAPATVSRLRAALARVAP